MRLTATGILFLLPLMMSADITWEQTSANVEAAFGEASLQANYPFTNTGAYPVSVLGVETSCGCTYAASSQQVLEPGESAEVAVFFETDKREGPQRSTILVMTDDPQQPKTTLTFTTDIPPAATLPQRTMTWKPDAPLDAQSMDIITEPGVALKLGNPKRPLPIKAELVELESGDAYRLTITPEADSQPASGLLPIEAYWGQGSFREYSLYLRIGKR